MGKLVTEQIGGVIHFPYACTGYITNSKGQDLDRKVPEFRPIYRHANTATDNHQKTNNLRSTGQGWIL